MHTPIRKRLTIASLLAFSAFLHGCDINSEANPKDDPQVDSSCAESLRAFDPGTAPQVSITNLPLGRYDHASAEIYAELKFVLADGSTNLSRVQFLETPVARTVPPTYSTPIRCRETSGTALSFFAEPALVTDFVHAGANDFDANLKNYSIRFANDQSASMLVTDGGNRRTNLGSITRVFSDTWNNGVLFTNPSPNVYIFYGERFESSTGLMLHVKAVYIRSGL
jgi:hypothetical protein